jgi:hypothetical protein
MTSEILPQFIDSSQKIIARVKNSRPSYLVKLGREPLLLKAEFYPQVNTKDAAKAVNNLMRSDKIYMAYPNALRLSHIYSKILPTESIAVQKLALRKKGMVILPVINDRKIILGPLWS